MIEIGVPLCRLVRKRKDALVLGMSIMLRKKIRISKCMQLCLVGIYDMLSAPMTSNSTERQIQRRQSCNHSRNDSLFPDSIVYEYLIVSFDGR